MQLNRFDFPIITAFEYRTSKCLISRRLNVVLFFICFRCPFCLRFFAYTITSQTFCMFSPLQNVEINKNSARILYTHSKFPICIVANQSASWPLRIFDYLTNFCKRYVREQAESAVSHACLAFLVCASLRSCSGRSFATNSLSETNLKPSKSIKKIF